MELIEQTRVRVYYRIKWRYQEDHVRVRITEKETYPEAIEHIQYIKMLCDEFISLERVEVKEKVEKIEV